MLSWFSKKPEPAPEKREYVKFPSPKTPDGERRFDELSETMDVAGGCGPKYASRLLLHHILSLEERINDLERKAIPPTNQNM